jgi:hypothetical protein
VKHARPWQLDNVWLSEKSFTLIATCPYLFVIWSMTNTYILTFVPIRTIDTDWSGWSITKYINPQWLKEKLMWHFLFGIIIGFVMWEET